MAARFPKTWCTSIHPVHAHISWYRDDRRGEAEEAVEHEEKGKGLVGAAQCEFTFRGLFSRIIQAAHRLFVYRPFSPFCPFSPGVQGGFFVCDGFSRKKRRAEGEDSGHCGTIRTKVAIATEFKGAEEWRPMQIEGFLSYVATMAANFSRLIDIAADRIRVRADEIVRGILVTLPVRRNLLIFQPCSSLRNKTTCSCEFNHFINSSSFIYSTAYFIYVNYVIHSQ